MRSCDWSSHVFSSDLLGATKDTLRERARAFFASQKGGVRPMFRLWMEHRLLSLSLPSPSAVLSAGFSPADNRGRSRLNVTGFRSGLRAPAPTSRRSEESRVGKEGVSKGNSKGA